MSNPNFTNTKQSKMEIAYTKLRTDILNNTLQPRQIIIESEICNELTMSRTPVREALQRLAYEGLIEYIPDKGMFVSQLKFTDILEIAEVRIPTECLAVKLAIDRITNNDILELEDCLAQHEKAYLENDEKRTYEQDNLFHITIAKCSKNSRLEKISAELIEQSARGTYMTVHDPERIKLAIKMHRDILKAIQERDSEKAVICTKNHLESWVEYTKNEQINNFYMYN